jgi:hypothetical protein
MTLTAGDRLAILDVITRADEAASRHAVTRSVLLIVAPEPPPAVRAAALITQELHRAGDTWLITRRTVAPATQ